LFTKKGKKCFCYDVRFSQSKNGQNCVCSLNPGGGGGNRFSDGRISPKKLVGFRIWRIFYTDFRILLIQRIADLSNILTQIVDLVCNLVRIPDCDFIVELLADSNLDKTIVGSQILLQIRADQRIFIPPPPPPPNPGIQTLNPNSLIILSAKGTSLSRLLIVVL
jgi:hypothetical protein